jgi:helix-hairpin-helix protein
MSTKVRINLANRLELLELPGLGPQQAEAIVRFRAEHGPITDARQLAVILSGWPASDAQWEQVDFSPSDGTAPEAPGA